MTAIHISATGHPTSKSPDRRQRSSAARFSVKWRCRPARIRGSSKIRRATTKCARDSICTTKASHWLRNSELRARCAADRPNRAILRDLRRPSRGRSRRRPPLGPSRRRRPARGPWVRPRDARHDALSNYHTHPRDPADLIRSLPLVSCPWGVETSLPRQ